MKIAAIDIGSNAARLLIVDVQKNNSNETIFNKVNLIRVPLRLGFDVFDEGFIGADKEEMLMNTMQAFKHLLKAYKVKAVKACATSAMRDASNSKAIVKEVKNKTNIKIEIISGDDEASLIFDNHISETLNKSNAYIYIDVGGGSTEVDFFVGGKQVYKKSFNVGTIRLLNNQWDDDDWKKMKEEIKKNIKSKLPITVIGSGGNINKIFSLSKTKEGKPLSLRRLKTFYHDLSALSVKERIEQLNLKEDRADVIVPALQIYINLMRWTDAAEIFVPKIGVSDGLVRDLYHEISRKN
ncbi:MAG TPA: exopolyphosphatase [Arachidicoccus soli]|uniref:Exopolyphosphatase n=1 Tax=Arachidicoccus soli TaxID=2341117 RepID=A0A386HLU9_9BACT|nr:exopolyphosphatase [Arachidicoccus soli]AYD46878.1 exopolyphosphatase [Arachidicoccus soli]HEU0228526.1 exopolyphosphatase [Arachidicoccus soli]